MMLFGILGFIFFFSSLAIWILYRGRQPEPVQLIRINSGQPQAEWTSTGITLRQVKQDYLKTVAYIEDWTSQTKPDVAMCSHIESRLAASFRRRFQLYARYRQQTAYFEVFRCDHTLTVRHFSTDAQSCILLDFQTNRRLILHVAAGIIRPPVHTLADQVLVYRMVYDAEQHLWQIADYIQSISPKHLASLSHEEPLMNKIKHIGHNQ